MWICFWLQNLRADGTQEVGAITSAPAAMHSASQPRPNASPSAAHFVANNFSNMTTWMPSPATFQAPTGMPKTPATPGPPGLASTLPSPPNSTIQSSSLEAPRNFMPSAPILSNPPIQHGAVTMHPSASPPGPWLHPHQIGGFARPSFSPYATVIPGPYPIPTRNTPPQSVSYPDIQPPGVSPASFTAVGQLSVGSGQTELPPGIGKPRKFNLKFLLWLHLLYIAIML